MIKRRLFMVGVAGSLILPTVGCQSAVEGSITRSNRSADLTNDNLRAAFQFAYPIYEYARVAQNRTQALNGQPGRLNTLRHRSVLMDHTSRNVTGPNVDTLYSSAFLDLSSGPLELFVPTDLERYFSIAFMNILTDNFAYIGTRASRGRGGAFFLVGPDWVGDAPNGSTLVRCDSNDVWMLGRTLVSGASDLEEAIALQTQIILNVPASNAPSHPYNVEATGDLTGAKFLAVVNDMLARSPKPAGEIARAAQFEAFGIGAKRVSSDLIARWDEFIPLGLSELREKFLYRDLIIDGWAYQEKGVGNFGDNDALRAAVALGGLAALGEEEAMYFHANLDPDGQPLRGDRTYRWRVPAGGVPADAFWSLTMYETLEEGRHFLTKNPINRYAIGDRTRGLHIDSDGSLEILIQNETPPPEQQSNWLPAPKGRFRLALRAYLPRAELRNRVWTVPPLLAD